LTVLHTESSLGWGGQEIRTHQEALAIARHGHRVLIAAPEESLLIKEVRSGGPPLIPLPLPMHRLAIPSALSKLRKWIAQYPIDIINTHSSRDSWIASVAGRLSSCQPRILRTRHIQTDVHGGRLIYGLLPHHIITTSEAIRRDLMERCAVPKDRIQTIPTGIDETRFHPGITSRFREEIGIGKEQFLVGMVSVLRSWKGHRYFLEAADRLRRSHPHLAFVIVGEGPARPSIEALRRALHLEEVVLMTGHRRDVPEVLAALDLLVLPSYAHEGIPQAILQAQAMARGVVASDIGGIREVVQDGETGLLAPPRDVPSLARCIATLTDDATLRERLGQQARARVLAQWTLRQMTDRILALYQELLPEA
jgi:glycosyltransferase involved in cell wall biosynthesis